MKKTFIVFMLALLVLFSLGWKDIIYSPLIRGDVDGIPFVWTFKFADITADTWVIGDTTTAGMYVPSQPLEITNVEMYGDPDAGDSIRVVVYSAAGGGTSNAEVAGTSAWLVGTTWAQTGTATVSATYDIITPTEGLGVLLDFKAGTPNSCTLTIEGIYRQTDSDE
jgi:hypothetical protein